MDRRLMVAMVVGVAALLGIGLALRPPSTEPSAVKTLAPRPSPPPAAPPDESYVPPPPAAAVADAPLGSPEAVQAHRETEFRAAVGQAIDAGHVACMLDAGIAHSIFADIPIAVKNGRVDADCGDVDPDLRTMCDCLAAGIEEMQELSIYDGMSFTYELAIYMKD